MTDIVNMEVAGFLFQLRVSEMVMVRKEMYVYGKESMQKWNAD